MDQQPLKMHAKFLHGSMMRHIVVMTSAGAAGLLAIFAVDFINIFYLNRLGQVEISAAAGYAATLFFFPISIGIGLGISATALVAPALGAGDYLRARRLVVNIHIFTFAASATIIVIAWPFIGWLLERLGASGGAKEFAASYLRIALPSTVFLTLGMVSAAVLRAMGDARRAMFVTLGGAIATVILDPIFIFGFGLGIEGAAIASSISRLAIMFIGLYGVWFVHRLFKFEAPGAFWADGAAIAGVAVPAVLSNLATPFANAYVTGAISSFGDEAMAGWTILGRLWPVTFVGVFALSGSIGPILGQNLGARIFERVRDGFTKALIFTGYYTLGAWLLLALVSPYIIQLMRAGGGAADLIAFFCLWTTPLFVFMGALFVSNAAFNDLGRPRIATYLNWGRATVGTIPATMIGADIAGAKGAIVGQMLGGCIFGAAAVYLCYRYIDRLQARSA